MPASGAAIAPAELKAFCQARLSPFKVPKRFIAVDSPPTTPTGKTLRRKLWAQALDGAGG